VPTLLAGKLDRLLGDMLLTGARRRWPLLSLVPARWLRPLLLPAARRLRISLARGAMFTSLAAITTAAALLLLP
jgi:hypothetical protein